MAQVQAVIASDPLSSTTVRTGPVNRSACLCRQRDRLIVADVAMDSNRRLFIDDMGRSFHCVDMNAGFMSGCDLKEA